ncbi:sulfotransferase family protein [Ulvibacterium sp.]|uniref:sulfotransferase family protein n=1 Tax=Ulvibacterium sp. TaxID=2665914 RepID=UPI003BA9E826
MKKPNLFIVGAPKCGTTFLYEKLKVHPDLFFPKIKELNYFSYEQLNKVSYYKDFKIKSLDKYLNYYKSAKRQKYLVDASVSYFTFDDVPSKVKQFNPEAKIILLVRDPYKRAYSHYLMDKRMGYANRPLQEYLEDPYSFHYRQYVANSAYFEQLKKYRQYFKLKDILIIELERFEVKFNTIFQFLDVESIKVDFNHRVNENKVSINSLGKLAQKNRGLIERIKILMPESLVSTIKSLVYREAEKINIPRNELELLKKLIEPDYKQFQEVIKNEN